VFFPQAVSGAQDVETLYRISYVKLSSLPSGEVEAIRKLEANPRSLRNKLVELNNAYAEKQRKEVDRRARRAQQAETEAKAHPERSDLQKKFEDAKNEAMFGGESFVIQEQVSETSAKALMKWQPGLRPDQLLRPGELDFIDPLGKPPHK
jgi:hypothetical protein